MGIKLINLSSSSYDPAPPYRNTFSTGNPDPNKFEIKKFEVIGNCIIVKIHYPDCTNFEGNKIVVYRGVSAKELLTAGKLDPHFFDGTGVQSPIARFVPTDEGWNMAVHFCKHYTGKIY